MKTSPPSAGLAQMGVAWLEHLKDIGARRNIPQDILAGITVAAVALPLNLALAVASGLPPGAGIISGVVGGGIAAILGGSAVQVTGPAAALSVLVLAIARDFGVVGVAAAAALVGLAQLVAGFLRAGKYMSLLPESVVAGFTTGVGLKLLDIQIPELLGFDYHVFELAAMMHQPRWLHQVDWHAVVCGIFVAFLVVSLRPYPRFPAALVGIGLVTFVANYVGWGIERVGAIPSALPAPSIPLVPDEKWLDLLIAATPLAILAAAESLISARAVDRMAKVRPHDADVELVGQGFANVAAGIFSGMPVTGVVVRSGVNIQSGGRTKLAALVHSAALLLGLLYIGGPIARIPLAGLAGLLCVVGFRLIETKTLAHLARTDRAAALAFLATAAGTASGHLVLGLVVGIGLEAVASWMRPGRSAHEEQEAGHGAEGKKRLRAVLGRERAAARRPGHDHPETGAAWLANVRERALVASSAFIHGRASVIGKVVLGDHVHVAAGSSVRADEGAPFFIGSSSNIQDGVIIHALKDRHVRIAGEDWAVYVGENVSMAHGAIVHGPCYVGDHTFIGFKAVVHDSIVGARCFIGIGAVVVGVEVPDGKFVPHGAIVDTAEKVEQLPDASEAHGHFNADVVEVNRGLAAAYRETEAPPRRGPLPAVASTAVLPPVALLETSAGAPADRF